MSLPRRGLGSSGVEITRVGFGAWALGGGGWAYSWGPQDDNDSVATMRHAIEKGINWIDTAAVYGLGHSEKVVGQFLRELPTADRPMVIFLHYWGTGPAEKLATGFNAALSELGKKETR